MMAEVREYVYIINIDDWTPQNHYNTAMSLPDVFFLIYFVGDSRLLLEPLYINTAPTTNINLITASA